MSCFLTLCSVGAFLFVVDRILIWCELRGWIYYRLSPRPVHTAIGNTLLAIEEMYRPSRRHVIEMRVEEAVLREEDDDGAGADSDACDDKLDHPGPRQTSPVEQASSRAQPTETFPSSPPADGFCWGDPRQDRDDPKSPH